MLVLDALPAADNEEEKGRNEANVSIILCPACETKCANLSEISKHFYTVHTDQFNLLPSAFFVERNFCIGNVYSDKCKICSMSVMETTLNAHNSQVTKKLHLLLKHGEALKVQGCDISALSKLRNKCPTCGTSYDDLSEVSQHFASCHKDQLPKIDVIMKCYKEISGRSICKFCDIRPPTFTLDMKKFHLLKDHKENIIKLGYKGKHFYQIKW